MQCMHMNHMLAGQYHKEMYSLLTCAGCFPAVAALAAGPAGAPVAAVAALTAGPAGAPAAAAGSAGLWNMKPAAAPAAAAAAAGA